MRLNDAFAFIPVIRASQRPPEALAELKRLGLRDVSLENRLEVRNENGTHEIVLIGAVGGSWWDDSGITEEEFRNALKSIPKGSRINVLVNSEGGSVQEGLGIYNAIKERAAEITCRITGYAVSIASVFPLAASKVISPKSAIWMMHRAWSYAQGNDEDMEKAAAMLREHNETLIDIYVAETGKTREEWEAWMKAETWVRGSKAIEFGLADETDEEEDDTQASYRPMHPDFISRCKNISPEILNCISVAAAKGEENKNRRQPDTAAAQQSPAPQGKNQTVVMNKQKMLALLKTWGVEVNDAMTDDQLIALVEAGKPAKSPEQKPEAKTEGPATKAEIAEALAQLRKDIAHENTVNNQLAALVTERRITQATADKLRDAVIKDASVLAALKENPPMPEAAEPVAKESELSVEASPKETVLAISRFDRSMKAWQKGEGNVSMKQLSQDSLDRAHFIEKHAKKILPVLNTNTVATWLKRSVIMQMVIKDFARKTMSLNMLSTVFSSVPLEGTNKIQVPFYDLDTSASQVFAAATGYETIGNTATDVREVEIGTGVTNGGRWYIGLSFSSEEIARQPFLKIVELARLKVEKLASDIVADVLSVVTAANYGAAAKTESADTFDSDDVIDVKLACKLWPEGGRSLILESAYDAALLKDPAFKAAYAAASDLAIKEGRLFPRVFGFDYAENPTLPENGEKLTGMALFKSAILVAMAPVPPVEEVRNAGTTYEIFTDPQSGVVLEYRTYGNNTLDSATHIAESSFGWAKGNGNAIKRICRP